MADDDKVIERLEQLRDDLYNLAVLQNPGMWVGGLPGQVVQAKQFAPNGAAPSKPQVVFNNTTSRPICVAIRAITDDNTDFTLLYGCAGNDAFTAAKAPALAFGRVVFQTIMVQPNGTLQIATISQTGNVLVATQVVPLKGAEQVRGAGNED